MPKLCRHPKAENLSLYNAWLNMRRRCTDPSSKDAKNYVLRGITFDPRWNTYDNFYDDMADGHSKGLTLDRRDNDKGYSKENCQWATRYDQSNNRRNNVRITINGKTQNLAHWDKERNIKYTTARMRISKNWSYKKVLGF